MFRNHLHVFKWNYYLLARFLPPNCCYVRLCRQKTNLLRTQMSMDLPRYFGRICYQSVNILLTFCLLGRLSFSTNNVCYYATLLNHFIRNHFIKRYLVYYAISMVLYFQITVSFKNCTFDIIFSVFIYSRLIMSFFFLYQNEVYVIIVIYIYKNLLVLLT